MWYINWTIIKNKNEYHFKKLNLCKASMWKRQEKSFWNQSVFVGSWTKWTSGFWRRASSLARTPTSFTLLTWRSSLVLHKGHLKVGKKKFKQKKLLKTEKFKCYWLTNETCRPLVRWSENNCRLAFGTSSTWPLRRYKSFYCNRRSWQIFFRTWGTF